ncbi:MAG TPA: GNAT family protein [Mycobacteriales bacterium]|nr:GNAT family protein [Mycobacteriales bacterium]
MAQAPDGRSLVGRTVRLDVASDHDADGLFRALDDDRVWEMGYGGSAPRPRSAGAWRQAMERARRDGRVMYVVRLIDDANPRDGRIVGTTSLGDLDLANEKVHLGWTAYAPDVWGTAVNPECKLLLLWHCFEHCGLGRVKLRTDVINVRSQAAIAKLGATREGVARRHIKRADGTWRDSVLFSVIVDDWARVKRGLEERLVGLCGLEGNR